MLVIICQFLQYFQICLHKKNKSRSINKFIRSCTAKNIEELRKDLSTQNWCDVYVENDVNVAYEIFLYRFIELYDINCPIKMIQNQESKFAKKPWITKGIKNACKKKNILYAKFVKKRTIESEEKYKKYKNKLVSIIRNSKKLYFYTLLEQQKQNMQGTWKVLNKIIKKTNNKQECQSHFINDNEDLIRNPKEIATEFNDYFFNVGFNLAKGITDLKSKNIKSCEYISRNPSSIYVSVITKNEILEIVNGFKNKRSTDWTDIDMI